MLKTNYSINIKNAHHYKKEETTSVVHLYIKILLSNKIKDVLVDTQQE